jgi:nucleotide-binding universal stress UspA family protein
VKRFLVPTDFSENAENALVAAIELAEKVNGQIIVVHTYKLIQRAGTFIGVEEMMRKDAEKDMAILLDKYREVALKGIQLTGNVIKGAIEYVVSHMVKESDIDLVVMGTQGSSGLKEVFIGSATNNVIRRTKAPVLAIPSDFTFRPFDRITIAVDGKGVDDISTYNPLLDIAKTFDSSISIIHISSDESEVYLQPELNDFFKEFSPTTEIIISNDISQAFQDFAKKNKSNLLCLLKRDRGFFDNIFHVSQTTKSIFYSELPLLILRES